MYTKIFTILLASLILGGCTMGNWSSNQAATDNQTISETPISSVAPTPSGESSKPLSQDTEVDSLQTDIESTVILEEDFSDL